MGDTKYYTGNANNNSKKDEKEGKIVARPTVAFPPSYWGDFFISYSPPPLAPQKYETRRKELNKEVKRSFPTTRDLASRLRLIDDLERLGVAYHFEEEIRALLEQIQKDDEETDDLRIAALRFQLLRQRGYNVPTDVLFAKFKDEKGKFEEELSHKPEGLLHLYEASWLGTREEKTLDEAREFARLHMERFVACTDSEISAKMKRALEMPYHRGQRRIEARHYIENIYKKYESSSHILLELAMLDFNRLQAQHQAEVKEISIWWRESGLHEKLGFFRDRIVEMYFWALGGNFELRYSKDRTLFAKLVAIMAPMDDMFDAYGTLEELQLFNDVIQRWDLQDKDMLLPEYMRIFLEFIRSVMEEIEEELSAKGRANHMQCLIESIKAWIGGYFVEAKWASSGHIPTLDEYLGASILTCGHFVLICGAPILMGEAMDQEVLDWLVGMPRIVRASSIISRLMDDLSTTEFEQERMHVASSVQCYMKEHGATEQEARARLREMVDDAWKDMNEEFLSACASKKRVCEVTLNYTRIMELLYKNDVGFTDCSGHIKDQIALLLVHPIKE